MKPAAPFALSSFALVLLASVALSFPPQGGPPSPHSGSRPTPLPRVEPESLPPGTPRHVPVPVLMQSLADAESVQVGRVAVIWRDTTDDSGKTVPYPYTERLKMARVNKAWLNRFASAFVDTTTKLSDVLPPLPANLPDGRQPWLATVIWFSSKSRGQTYMNFFQGCGFVGVGGRVPGGFWIEQNADTLLGLLCEALPADTVIGRLRAERKGVAYVAPTEEKLPGPDDQVPADVMPEAITKQPPVYPEEARAKGVQGTVIVKALVGRDGRVVDMRLAQGVEGLDEAALSAVRKWRFSPAQYAGKPVAVWVVVPVKFSLK